MKRSEMISLIVNSIELHNGNDPGWLEYPEMKRQKEQAYNVAHRLLSDLEQAGMLPPPTKTDVVTANLVYCYYPKITECKGNSYYYVLDMANSQLWEPEDEEK